MAEREISVEVMDDLSNDGSESAKSDVTVVSNPATKKKSPSEKVHTIDAFIVMAEGTIAESEKLLGRYPGSYNEEIEVQHCTVKQCRITLYAHYARA